MQSVTFVHVLAVVIVTQVNVLSWQCSWKLIVATCVQLTEKGTNEGFGQV